MKILIKHWTNKPFELEQEFQTVIETDICGIEINAEEMGIEIAAGNISTRKLRITDKNSIEEIFKHYGKSEAKQ